MKQLLIVQLFNCFKSSSGGSLQRYPRFALCILTVCFITSRKFSYYPTRRMCQTKTYRRTIEALQFSIGGGLRPFLIRTRRPCGGPPFCGFCNSSTEIWTLAESLRSPTVINCPCTFLWSEPWPQHFILLSEQALPWTLHCYTCLVNIEHKFRTELLSFQNCSQLSCQRMTVHYFALLKLIAWALIKVGSGILTEYPVHHSSPISWTSPSQLFRQLSNFLWFCIANYIILAHRISLGLTSESSDHI